MSGLVQALRQNPARLLGFLSALAIIVCVTVADLLTPPDIELAPLYVLALIAAGLTGASECCIWGLALFSVCGTLLRLTGIGDASFSLGNAYSVGVAVLTLSATAAVIGHMARASGRRLSEIGYRRLFEGLAVAVIEVDLTGVKRRVDELSQQGIHDLRCHFASRPGSALHLKQSVPITNANDTARRLSGMSAEVRFRSLADLCPDEEVFIALLVAMAHGETAFSAEAELVTPSQERIPVLIALNVPVGGDFSRVTISIMDVRLHRQLETALQRTRRELSDALRSASLAEVGAAIAHEMGQPLSAISGFLRAAKRNLNQVPPDLSACRQTIGNMECAIDRATNVVRQMRKAIGVPTADPDEFVFDEIVTDALQFIEGEADGPRVRVSVSHGAEGVKIMGDRALLQQVLVNLARNAAQAARQKEQPDPCVTVRTTFDGQNICLEVEDNGAGFTEVARRGAFASFLTANRMGLGLGLAICRSAVELHGGNISISRTDVTGSLLLVKLPAAQPS